MLPEKLMSNIVQSGVLIGRLNQLTCVARPEVLLILYEHCWGRNDVFHPTNRRERHDWIVGHVSRLVLMMGSARSWQRRALGLSSSSPYPVQERDLLDSGSGYCGNWASICRLDMGSLKHWHHVYHWRFSCEEVVHGRWNVTILRPNKKHVAHQVKTQKWRNNFAMLGRHNRTSKNSGIGGCHQFWLSNICDRVWYDCYLNIVVMWSYPIQRIENRHYPQPRKALRAGTRRMSCYHRSADTAG